MLDIEISIITIRILDNVNINSNGIKNYLSNINIILFKSLYMFIVYLILIII